MDCPCVLVITTGLWSFAYPQAESQPLPVQTPRQLSQFQTAPTGLHPREQGSVGKNVFLTSMSWILFLDGTADASTVPQREGPRRQGLHPVTPSSSSSRQPGVRANPRVNASSRNSRLPGVIHWLLISQCVTHPDSKVNF